MDLEAFDVLTADIDDEIDVGAEMAGRLEMGDGLDETIIDAQRGLDEVFAIPGDRGGDDLALGGFEFVDLL